MENQDRELLELAAKAAGIEVGNWVEVGVHRGFVADYGVRPNGICWNPRDDDGDNRRLQAALEIDVLYRRVGGERVEAVAPSQQVKAEYCNPSTREAATRMAVLRAAAAIGKAMP